MTLSRVGLCPSAAGTDGGPLSRGQRALWFLDRLAPGASAYVLAGALRVKGPLDVPALCEAVEALMDRHPALRTSFHEGEGAGGEPVQRVYARRAPTFFEAEAMDWDEAAVEAWQSELAWSPFDLERDPLLRVGVLHRRPDEHRLVFAFHHIVVDFWSLGVFLGELSRLYRERDTDTPPQDLLSPLRSTYAEQVQRQERRLAGLDGERLWEFWRRELRGRKLVLDLPADRPRTPAQTFQGGVRSSRLEAVRTDRLRVLARERGTTLFVTLLAAFEALLYRYTGERELVVGAPTSGRGSASSAGLIGYFVNPVVLRGDLAGDLAFTDLLAGLRQTVLAALAHRAFPFPLLAERLAPERDPGRSPVFQVMLTFEQERGERERGLAALAVGEAGVAVELGGLAAETAHLSPGGAQVDLNLQAAVIEDRLVASFQFRADLFDGVTMARMAGHFRDLLAGILEAPEARLSDLPLLSGPERQALRERNDTAVRYPEAGFCLQELIAAQAARAPDAVAVVCAGQALSYGGLAACVSLLSGRLRALGVGPEASR